ncbi:MAG: hypothetical protein JZU58_28590 [Curvibacter lanceolatus]|uniref:hypothetical protein n=1 Tax=Curvibacter lanceolatus TaxID=86182 RepID=UPI0023576B51|nr:hypothetical protein [Curvibacter lanceolatus]MBV5296317.1 hypothetical protein [Curvibacter lanceolatus]
MDKFDELAGRIEGISRALLHVVAMLEDAQLIDGPLLSREWHQAKLYQHQGTALSAAADRTLRELAHALDGARTHRRSAGHPA